MISNAFELKVEYQQIHNSDSLFGRIGSSTQHFIVKAGPSLVKIVIRELFSVFKKKLSVLSILVIKISDTL